MDHDSSDSPKPTAPKTAQRGSGPAPRQPDLPPQEVAAGNIDPAMVTSDEDDEARLPEVPEEPSEAVLEGRLAVGHAAIEYAVRLPPTAPGGYCLLKAAHHGVYVGKAEKV